MNKLATHYITNPLHHSEFSQLPAHIDHQANATCDTILTVLTLMLLAMRL